MNEVRYRKNKMIEAIQKQERRKFIINIRHQILNKQKLLDRASQIQAILYNAFICLQQQNGPLLDIYININQILNKTLRNNQKQYFLYKLSIFLYINLTSSNEVITFMIETSAVSEWRQMRLMVRLNSRCAEYLYERMRMFIELICAKYNIQFGHKGVYNEELNQIFSLQATNELIIEPFAFDQESEYYQFIQKYISYMPQSHLKSLILGGFAYEILLCDNCNPSLIILGRLELMKDENKQMQQIYSHFCSKIVEQRNAK